MQENKIKNLIQKMAEYQAQAFETGNIENFMQWFELDIISDYYMRRWFNGYAVRVANPFKCDVKLGHYHISSNELNCELVFNLNYQKYDSELVKFNHVIKNIDADENIKIKESTVILTKKEWHDQPGYKPLILAAPSLYSEVKKRYSAAATVRNYQTPYENTESKEIIIIGNLEELFENNNLKLKAIEHYENLTGPRLEKIITGTDHTKILKELNDVILNHHVSSEKKPEQLPYKFKPKQTANPGLMWWKDNEITEICKNSADFLKASLYSRAAPNSTRFRNTHPQLDSAAILSDMMTIKACSLAFSFGTDDLPQYCSSINHFAKKVMVSRTYNDLKQQNPSYFPASELSLQTLLSIDEIIEYWKRDPLKPAEAGCSEIASFYISMFRLGGMDPFKTFIIVQPFHYLTFFKLEKGDYVVSVNEIYPMTSKRLYGDTDVMRIVTPAFFLDETGQTNMPDPLLNQMVDTMHKSIPIFSIPAVKEKNHILPLTVEPEFHIGCYDTPITLYNALRKHIFLNSRLYPASPFTWAKYANQTLLVNQIEAYAIWSLKSPEIKKYAPAYNNAAEIIRWMANELQMNSIFNEPDRIMTADQVIRHKCGSCKDRALFLYTVLKHNNPELQGAVVITDDSSYVMIMKEQKIEEIYDLKLFSKVNKIDGKVIACFNEQASYAGYQSAKTNIPAWVDLIVS